ncbi:MAG: thioesterase family protein [Polaromonas sp.]|nr:thioesterase family protein [Polaromonas sp.]
MAGLLRNLLVILRALFSYRSAAPLSPTQVNFRVTPLDTGITTLKSDRYFQMAESAQFDYVIRTGLIRDMLAGGYSFVNLSQWSRFIRPIRLFSRLTVVTRVVHADDKCAWFHHSFHVQQAIHAEVFVKMKFKKGPVTVAPAQLLGPMPSFNGAKPAALQQWDEALASAAATPLTAEPLRF